MQTIPIFSLVLEAVPLVFINPAACITNPRIINTVEICKIVEPDALFVKIVLICTPFFLNDLISSKLLYAEIPPHIISNIFLFSILFIK